MKNKYLKILLIILLIAGILVGVIFFKSRNNEVDLDKMSKEVVELLNDENYTDFYKNYMDTASFLAFGFISIDDIEGSNDSELNFDEMYDFFKDIENHSSSEVVKKYSNLIDILVEESSYTDDEKEEMVEEVAEKLGSADEEIINQIKSFGSKLKVSIDSIGSLEKVKNSDKLYKVEVKEKLTSIGNNESTNVTDTVYLVKNGKDYKFAISEQLYDLLYGTRDVLNDAMGSYNTEEIKIENIKLTFQLIMSDINSEFMSVLISDRNATISNYVTYGKLNEKLQKYEYTIYATSGENGELSTSAVGSEIYISDNSGNKYKVKIISNGNTSVSYENLEVVE